MPEAQRRIEWKLTGLEKAQHSVNDTLKSFRQDVEKCSATVLRWLLILIQETSKSLPSGNFSQFDPENHHLFVETNITNLPTPPMTARVKLLI
jgi:hypothetical protein